jgi:glycosyltransferase involved in cell wall biosynthesis
VPRYTLIAAPYALRHHVPMVHWHTHKSVSWELRAVHRLVQRIVTATPESFTLKSDKVTVLGHGIDLSQFIIAPPSQERLILAVGRLSPIKHYEALIEGAAELMARPGFDDVQVAIVGGITPENGQAYADALKQVAEACRIAERVQFLGPVPHEEIANWYQGAALTINLCPTGGADKVVLESMASGVPVIVRNETFLPLLGNDSTMLWCENLRPSKVANRLESVLNLTYEERAALGKRLSDRVQSEYDLDAFIDRLVGVFQEVTR